MIDPLAEVPKRQSSLDLETARNMLREEAARIEIDPQTNSVFAVARRIFRGLDGGELSLGDVASLVDDVHLELLKERVSRFRAQHAPDDGGTSWSSVEARLEAAAADGFDAFKAFAETVRGGIVFTAHPTFALSKTLRTAMAAAASGTQSDSNEAMRNALAQEGPDWSASISLEGEHSEVQHAISEAHGALAHYAHLMLKIARAHFPQQWRRLRPALPSIATWVGYDLDGRTDIHWSQSLAFKLSEKATQLARYRDCLARLADDGDAPEALQELAEELGNAARFTEHQANAFREDLSDPAKLVEAANLLTRPHAARLTSVDELCQSLDHLIDADGTEDDLAEALIALRAEVETLGLGAARIHLRLNAAQIRTLLQRDLALETEDRELGRVALKELSAKAANSEVRDVNFADLFLEQSTARRQFMMCAQILKHIDETTPIRFLIAESENPATVMGALYLARQYGVAEKLDISPLFETPEALESGGRFIERLLEEPEFIRYVDARGQLALQFGFSDAGRFIGQVAADMAIERIHNLAGRALADKLPSAALLVFNTHGESMGRGAFPGHFEQRFNHLLTPWTRAGFNRRQTPLRHEMSFQGGDGFLHFATPELAHASLAAFCEHALADPKALHDRTDTFYSRTDFTWDFYRALRQWHEALFANADYGHMLGDFAQGFLVRAGSRQTRRAGGEAGPRALRAISNNATLQQLGTPLNTAAGIGSALARESDELVHLINTSPRMSHLIALALEARILTSLPALRAYGELYNPGYWLALARSGSDHGQAFQRVADVLKSYQTTVSINRIADELAVDLGEFDALLARLDDAPSPESRHERRIDLHVLHAARQALMMQAFALAGRLRSISPRYDTGTRDIVVMVSELRLNEAIKTLRDIYPLSDESADLFEGLSEPGYLSGHSDEAGYRDLHEHIIEPLEEIARQIHTITLAISHVYNAYG